MSLDDIKGNTNKSKEIRNQELPERRAEAVATGKVKKATEFDKIKKMIFLEDPDTVKKYVFKEIIGPGIRDLVYKTFTDSLSMFLFKDTSRSTPSKKTNGNGTGYRYSYNSCYPDASKNRSAHIVEAGADYDYDTVIFETRGEAERVRDSLREIIGEYNWAKVSDLYDLSHISSKHTDCKYGWNDLRDASIVRTHEGYTIQLPSPRPID